jgi:hypothetical protein
VRRLRHRHLGLALLEEVPPEKRQPNLLLALVRRLFGTQPDPAAFRRVVLERRSEVLALLRAGAPRRTSRGAARPY